MRILRGMAGALSFLIALAALLLVPAALLSPDARPWPRGMVFLAALGAVLLAGRIAMAIWRPASLEGRRQAYLAARAKKQPLIDAIGLPAYLAFLIAWTVFIPLDVFRLRLLPQPPDWAAALGLVLAVAGSVITQLAVWQNAFATPAIQDQSDRGQTVIDTGVYALIRHPLYAGNLLLFAGAALWLGSLAALIATLVQLAATLFRIEVEERFLRERLPDYADYAGRVRGRLIPFVL
jgi:protein-S-isoprenylcysteine O-methyltransferase Ste14